jgi:hypothetical protein
LRRAIAALPFRTIRKAGFARFVGDGSGACEHAAGSAVEEAIFEHQNDDMLDPGQSPIRLGTPYQLHPVPSVPLSLCWLGPARSVGYDNCLEIENWYLPNVLFSYSSNRARAAITQARLTLVNLNVSARISVESTFVLRAR